MTIVGVYYGAALLLTGAAAACAPRRPPHIRCWAMLAIGWAVTCYIVDEGARFVWVWTGLDFIFGMVAMGIGLGNRLRWAVLLAILFLLQTFLHIIWGVTNVSTPISEARVYVYYLTINILFICQMVTVACPALWDRFRHRGIAA